MAEAAVVWAERKAFMEKQMEILKRGLMEDILVIYRRRDLEEDSCVDYAGTVADVMTDAEQRGVRRKAMAIYMYYDTMLQHGPMPDERWCAWHAAQQPGVWLTATTRSADTVRKWEAEYRQWNCSFPNSLAGKWERDFIIDEPEVKGKCLSFVRSKAKPKGKPNMAVSDFSAFFHAETMREFGQQYT